MHSSPRLRAVLLALAFFAIPARARAERCKFRYEALARSPVGAWAEYQVAFAGRAETGTQRYALVERSARRLVLEIDVLMAIGPSVIHLEYAPERPAAWRLVSGTIRMANGRKIPLPPSAAEDYALIKKGVGLGEPLAAEIVATQRGPRRCEHWRRAAEHGAATTDFWTDDSVFPVGLVRSEAAAQGTGKGMTLSLVAVGRGARAKLSAAELPPSSRPASSPDQRALGGRSTRGWLRR